MTSRERIKITLNHKEPDRVPILDGPWDSTIERWKKEGLPPDCKVSDYFGYEINTIYPDISLQFPYEILKEDDEYIVERNIYGEIIKNHKNRSTTPLILDNSIKSKKDWDELKGKLKVNNERGLTRGALEVDKIISLNEGLKDFKENYKSGKYILYTSMTGLDLAQRYVGQERVLMAIATEPEWIKDMILTNAKFIIEMY